MNNFPLLIISLKLINVDGKVAFTGETKEITKSPVISALVRDRITGETKGTTNLPVISVLCKLKFTGENEESFNSPVNITEEAFTEIS